MAEEKTHGSASENALDEAGHYFDFARFYRRMEVCDRTICLEILADSEEGSELACCEEIPVSSIVVAAKSLVLQKMLFSGMRESDKGAPIIIRVTNEENDAFKEMIRFFYAGSLAPRFHDPATNVRDSVRLLVLGDKFEVPSLMGAVLECLSKREKSVSDSAVLVDQLPEILFQFERVKRAVDEARAHVIEAFKDVSVTWDSEEFDLSLSPEVLEILLQSEELEADSEQEIVEKSLAWIRGSYQSESERRRLVDKLTQHIRFFCIDGEFLESLLAAPEMQSEPTQALINNAFRFQAYSDAKKEALGKVACQRKGVRDVHLEIISEFVLDEPGTRLSSRSALWFGKEWYVELDQTKTPVPTVSVNLCCKPASNGSPEASSTADEVEAQFFVKIWPNDIWKFCGKTDPEAFSVVPKDESSSGWGLWGALNVSWEEARTSERFLGSTGAVTIKVVARRFRSPKQ
ncbi:BTB/POZ/Kelch-associated protein [Klebsormidium nitens]|uniref:BTB/POZ/Kelch-associated protein n=1 Tax=Klebsormidium nitens TaxID=105231 RepID=A0A1Y1IHF0_KLENI|nr:BTB/POZ/Kelch-associated protein [Klebsormidium nitens]|eukprot:GAQ87558.1 BTB/POZ/Kelch-associated protein [Klebsormidium nitens]